MNNKVKELETRKAELLEKLGQLADNIIAERDNFARKIFETEAEVAKTGQVRPLAPVTEDIYNPEAVLAAGTGETKEDLQKRLKVMFAAYSTNPFCDTRKAAAALEILEELQQIAGELDSFYNGEVAKKAAALEMAKKEYKAATAARLQHQRETNGATSQIRRAAAHSIIGDNDLFKHGVDKDSFSGGDMIAGVGYDGFTIIGGAIDAINRKTAAAERLRNTPGRVENTVTTFTPSHMMPGEPVADMIGHNESGLKNWLKSFYK